MFRKNSKSSGLGGAVGLLFPDKKDKKEKKGRKSLRLEREQRKQLALQLERDELIHEHALRELAIQREMQELNRAKARERHTSSRSLKSSTPAPVSKIASPPRRESLPVPQANKHIAPVFREDSTLPAPSASPNLSDTSAVDMNPSIASFISARRRTLKDVNHRESASEDSEIESVGLSMTSSTLFYGGSRPRRPTVTTGTVMSPSLSLSPAPSSNSHQRRPSRLSQNSAAASDTDDAEYATADDHSPEGPSPVVEGNDRSSLHSSVASTIGPSKQRTPPRGSPAKVDESEPFATIRERRKERGQLSPFDTPEAVVLPRSVRNEGRSSTPDATKYLHAALPPTPNLPSARDASQPEQRATSPIGLGLARAAYGEPNMQFHINQAGSEKSPASKQKSDPPPPRASLDVPGSEMETERAGTFGYATRGSAGRNGSAKPTSNGGHMPAASARVPSVACAVSSPFARGVEGDSSPANVAHGTPTLSGSPSASSLVAASASRYAHASLPAPPSRIPTLTRPLVSRSPVQAHSVLSSSRNGSAVALGNDNNAGKPSDPTWVYHPTSAVGKRSLVRLAEVADDDQTAKTPTTPSDYAVFSHPPTSIFGMSSITVDRESLISSNARYTESTTSSKPMSNMSTSSLTSSRVASIRPPSLSAVTSNHSKPRTKPRGPRMSSSPKPPPTPTHSTAYSRPFEPKRASGTVTGVAHSSSGTDTSSSDEDEQVPQSPQSRFDFSSPRPGFVPSPSMGSGAWINEEESASQFCGVGANGLPSPFGLRGFRNRFSDPREEDEDISKRGSDLVSEPNAPQLSTSSSSYETSTELQSPRETPAFETRKSDDSAYAMSPTTHRDMSRTRMMTASTIMEDDYLSPATANASISHFARASFGCDGADAEKERGEIAATSTKHMPYAHAANNDDTDNNSACDSDLEESASDNEYPHHDRYARAQMRSQARADFFARGSASGRHGRTSRASVDSLPANHEDIAFDLTHLRTSMLPEFDARRSLSSLRVSEDKYTPAIPMPRQKSLSNLVKKHEAIARRNQAMKSSAIKRSQSSPGLPGRNQSFLEDEDEFSVSKPPSQRRMFKAGTSFLYDEDGNVICFGDLFPSLPTKPWEAETIHEEGGEAEGPAAVGTSAAVHDGPPPRTVVFFIRSFWCGMCQDYTLASIARLDPVLLKQHNISVAVIGPGHWKMLKSYRELFKCPFPFYTDPSRKLYRTMGMIKYGMVYDEFSLSRADIEYHQSSLPNQAAMGIVRGVQHMPRGYSPGNLFQLGGEFILSPGYKCDFAHRMKFFGDHLDARKVLQHAGIDHPEISPMVLSHGEQSAREELDREAKAASAWQEERDKELERMRLKKAARRKFGTTTSNDELKWIKTVPVIPALAISKAEDDARSEWGEYVHDVLGSRRTSIISRRSSRVVSSLFEFDRMLSPDPKRASLVESIKETEEGEARDDIVLNSPTPRERYFSEDPAPQLHNRWSGSTSSSTSPRPPYRGVASPTRKAVPLLSDEEKAQLQKESERLSLVMM